MGFKKLLLLLIISIPSIGYCEEPKITKEKTEYIVRTLYGPDDLGENKAFTGGYINFGYWKDINYSNPDNLTGKDRTLASENLYKLIFDKLNLDPKDQILEVGCGRGYGATYLVKHYPIASLVALDLTPEQIMRAKEIHKPTLMKYPYLSFQVVSAHSIPQPSGSFTKIYTVEAIQHFHSVEDFAREAARLLTPGGKIVITAHLPTNQESYEEIKRRIPVVADYQDRSTLVTIVRKAFINNGFNEEFVESIGEYVFEGSDVWLAKVNDLAWTRDILKLHNEGHWDYYVLSYIKKG